MQATPMVGFPGEKKYLSLLILETKTSVGQNSVIVGEYRRHFSLTVPLLRDRWFSRLVYIDMWATRTLYIDGSIGVIFQNYIGGHLTIT